MEFISNLINTVTYYLSSFGFVGGFLLIVLESMFPILPFGLFVGLNILAFGNIVGYIMSYIATVIGTFLVFLFFRKIVKKYFTNYIENPKRKKIRNLIDKITHMDFNTLVVIMAIPFLPTSVLNVAAGLSDMSYKKYLLVLIIGKISITYFWGYIGKSALESIKDPKILIKVIIMVLVAYIVSKIAEKIFKIKE